MEWSQDNGRWDRGVGTVDLSIIAPRTARILRLHDEIGRTAARGSDFPFSRKTDGKDFKCARFVPGRNGVKELTDLEEI